MMIITIKCVFIRIHCWCLNRKWHCLVVYSMLSLDFAVRVWTLLIASYCILSNKFEFHICSNSSLKIAKVGHIIVLHANQYHDHYISILYLCMNPNKSISIKKIHKALIKCWTHSIEIGIYYLESFDFMIQHFLFYVFF